MVEHQGALGADLPAETGPVIPELRVLASLLQQAREAQGFSLVALSQRLHMGLEQLEALESGDSARLREPVFVIAQARRVAECLGLEIGPQIEALRRSEAFNACGPALRNDAFKPVAPRSAAAQPTQAKPQPAKFKAAAAKPAASGARPLRWVLPLLLLGAAVAAAAAVLVPRERVLVMLTPLNGLLPAKPVPAARPVLPLKTAVVPKTQPQPKPQPVASELVLIAPQTSWLEVRNTAGGPPLFRGMLKGEKRFPLGSGIRLLAGRPDVVRVSLGGSAPKVLGTIKDIRWFTFASKPQPKPALPIKPPSP